MGAAVGAGRAASARMTRRSIPGSRVDVPVAGLGSGAGGRSPDPVVTAGRRDHDLHCGSRPGLKGASKAIAVRVLLKGCAAPPSSHSALGLACGSLGLQSESTNHVGERLTPPPQFSGIFFLLLNY